mgnify:CR=1 FL=1
MADYDYKATRQPKPGSTSYLGGIVLPASGTLATGALALNKTSALLMIPKGFVCTGIRFRIGDADSGGSPAVVFKLGDSGDDDRLVTANTTAQAGGEVTPIAPNATQGHQAASAARSADDPSDCPFDEEDRP